MGTSQTFGHPDRVPLGGLAYASHPGESRNTPSNLLLQEPELSAESSEQATLKRLFKLASTRILSVQRYLYNFKVLKSTVVIYLKDSA